jgi:hypothetical protein
MALKIVLKWAAFHLLMLEAQVSNLNPEVTVVFPSPSL